MRVKPRRGGEADEERQADSDSEAAHHAVRSVSGMTAMPGASRIYSAAALRGLINEGERGAPAGRRYPAVPSLNLPQAKKANRG